MYVKICCVMMTQLLVVTSNLDHCSGCNTRLPSIGPRLLKAKTLFGEGVRLCKKEILKVVREVPAEQVAKLLRYSCSRYNACKDFFEDRHGTPLIKMTACLIQDLKDNETFYRTKFNLSDTFVPDMIAFLGCVQKFDAVTTDRQTMDDTMTVIRTTIMTYGWT
ncbi:uncharacterized protein LOC144141797 [Haemaphysalis longicornis]